MRKYLVPSLLLAMALLSACVPKDQYNAAITELNYYRNQSERADSLEASRAVSTYNSTGSSDVELQRRIQQVEALTATNMSLNRSFQDIKERYDKLLSQNTELLSASGEQVTTLQQNLAERAAQVSEQEQILRQKEIELQAREQQLAQLSNGTSTPNAYGGVQQPASYSTRGPATLSEAQSSALKQNQLQTQLAQVLVGYPRNEVGIAPRGNNEVVLTLAQSALFADGFRLDDGGRLLLSRISQVLSGHPTSQITVVGHSDASVDAVIAFENSTDRAIVVTQNMISHGISPQRILAASQGYYLPVANNNTAAERAANRRTEIVVTLP